MTLPVSFDRGVFLVRGDRLGVPGTAEDDSDSNCTCPSSLIADMRDIPITTRKPINPICDRGSVCETTKSFQIQLHLKQQR